MATVSAPTRIAIQNIMVATDFSACADSALKYAVGLANRYRSALYTVNVLPHTPFVESADVDPEKIRRSAESKMAAIAGSELFKGITHTELIREGEVANVLSDLVRQNHIDLIVLGTEGRTGLRKFLLGSVVEVVFRTAECPVLTLGPHASRDLGGNVWHLMFATDFGPESVEGLPYALSLAEEHRARLTLLHVAHEARFVGPEGAVPMMTPYEEVASGEQKLRKLIRNEPPLWQEPEYLVQFGEPAETILRIAAKDVDLIVLGVKRPALLTKHLGSGVAYRIVCEATCPVLSVGAQYCR
jgi:nucleotide-binding universal stress UspA family protein